MDNLTPTLNDVQIKQNIDALQKQGVGNDKIQAYVDNYQKGSNGNYTLKGKTQPTEQKQPLSESLWSAIAGGVASSIPGVNILKGANDLKNTLGVSVNPATNVSKIIDAGKAGVQQVKGGVQQSQDSLKQGGIKGFLNGLAGGIKTVAGGINTIFSPLAPATEPIGKAVNAVSDKISDIPTVQDFAMGQTGQNVAKGADVVGDLSTLAGGAAGFAGGENAKPQLSEALDKANKIVSEGANNISGISSNIVPQGDSIMNRVARLNPTDATKFEKMTGMTHGEYLQRTGNFGSPEDVIKNEAVKFTQSLKTVDDALAKLPGTYKSPQLTTALNELAYRETKVSSPGAPSPDLNMIKSLEEKNNTTGLTMDEINQAKRLYERNIKLDFVKSNAPEGIARATNIDNALRAWQFDTAEKLGLKNLPELNKQTQASKFIIDKLGKQLIGKTGNDAITLTDWIMLSGGEPTSVAGFLTKKLFSNKSVQARVAKMVSGLPDINQLKADYQPTVENGIRRGFPQGTQLELPTGDATKPQIQNNVPIQRNAPFSTEAPAKKIFNQSMVDAKIKSAKQK